MFFFFFFNDPATTEIYPLSLHDALPILYGLVELKTHAKTALIVRREQDGIRRYVHIGTGNYNAATAAIYTDVGLLSADPELGADLNDLFNELSGSSRPPQTAFRRILVSPTYLANRLVELIDREAAHARAGGGRLPIDELDQTV